jgi:hypothetical protein
MMIIMKDYEYNGLDKITTMHTCFRKSAAFAAAPFKAFARARRVPRVQRGNVAVFRQFETFT